jgi:hypothetical protein
MTSFGNDRRFKEPTTVVPGPGAYDVHHNNWEEGTGAGALKDKTDRFSRRGELHSATNQHSSAT